MNLFIKEDFISHAGLPLTWKVECDALTEKDYEALAKIVSEKLTFCDVKVGIRPGGLVARRLGHQTVHQTMCSGQIKSE